MTKNPEWVLIGRLMELTKNWTPFERVIEPEVKAELEEIGRELDKLGGLELMQYAYRQARLVNRSVVVIQSYWDGIGDWRW